MILEDHDYYSRSEREREREIRRFNTLSIKRKISYRLSQLKRDILHGYSFRTFTCNIWHTSHFCVDM